MKLQGDLDTLQQQPLLGLMDTEALRLLAFSAESRILRAGDLLFRRGDLSDGGYLVVSGSIALSTTDTGPAAQIIGAGGLIGEMALFTALERPATALAREPSQILKLPLAIMRRVLVEFPDSAARLAAAIAQRLTAVSGELSGIRTALRAIDGH
jgi:CRP-like cAMP-binding protein